MFSIFFTSIRNFHKFNGKTSEDFPYITGDLQFFVFKAISKVSILMDQFRMSEDKMQKKSESISKSEIRDSYSV